ncbi:recombinase family protein [Streptomyces gobiensis]|uniref:recombinase family protein n=1 Tax=Streptomyces gobiensis TaxID=2875706 RepID=UPI001E470413|nr:recombinase family protein [Streptomyces gobiensis]UGY94046.1 recombinase family protein [Streptomyces gobiensis]
MEPAQLVDLYIRRSKTGSLELSTAAQEARGRDWAARNNLTVRTVWTDMKSGSRADVKRPDYDNALAALRNGEVRTLWAYKLDRFSRMGAIAVLTILDELSGSRVIFDSDGLDSADPTHRRMIMWRAEDAKEEADRIGGRLKDTFGAAKDAGLWVPAKVPYGFIRTVGRKLAVDNDTAPIVRRIFANTIEGVSTPKLARALNEEGIPAPSGGRWSTSTLYGILRHPAYIGYASRLEGHKRVAYRDSKGNRVPIGPAIVSEATQAQAEQALNSRTVYKNGAKRGNRATPTHLLTGLLRCAGCDRTLVASGKSYRCTSASLGGRECPAPAMALREAVNDAVARAWANRLAASEPDRPLIKAVAKRWLSSHKPEVMAERDSAVRAVKDAQAGLQDLLDARWKRKEFEGPAAAYFPSLLADAESAVESAQHRLAELPEPMADISYLLDSELVWEAWEAASLSDQRDLLRLAIDRVVMCKAPGKGKPFAPLERLTFVWASE